jgi:hypothetical protein
MKKQLTALAVVATLLLFSTSSCKKDAESPQEQPAEVAVQAKGHSDDQAQVDSELDDVSTNVQLALETSTAFAGRVGDTELACDATLQVDSNSTSRNLTIVYNGGSCLGNRSRQGTVIISMPLATRWKNAGAAVTVTLQALKITRLSDNKSIIINGAQTFTNTSGGLLINLPTLGTITHTITSAGLAVKFSDSTQRTWQVSKQRVFTFNAGIVVSTTGTHTEGNVSGIAYWGQTRFGTAFTTAITQPIVIKQSCNARVTSGEVKHTTAGFTATALFGLDAAVNPTGCPGNGNFFYKLSWAGPAGNGSSVILPY